MKSRVLLAVLTFLSIGLYSQTITYYHIHDGNYYLVQTSGGMEFHSNGDIYLIGNITENIEQDPIGDNDPSKEVPECEAEKGKQGQTVVCGPYTCRNGTDGVIIEGCDNVNSKTCKITISNNNGGQIVFTYTES